MFWVFVDQASQHRAIQRLLHTCIKNTKIEDQTASNSEEKRSGTGVYHEQKESNMMSQVHCQNFGPSLDFDIIIIRQQSTQ